MSEDINNAEEGLNIENFIPTSKEENTGEKDMVELRKTYRDLVAKALRSTRNYDGSEEKYESLLADLIPLETLTKTHFTENKEILTREKEQEVSRIFHKPSADFSISALLEKAQSQFEALLKKEKIKAYYVELPGTILEPGEKRIPPSLGKGNEFMIHFEERLEKLLLLLQNLNVYTDDIIVCAGKVIPGAIRKVSYNIIEIPRIQKEILVCNQYGEATFVIQDILPREILQNNTKETLLTHYPDLIERVPYRSDEQWERDIITLLVSGKKTTPNKIDIKLRDEVRKAIMQEYTLDAFLEIENIKNLSVKNLSYLNIGRILGIQKEEEMNMYLFHLSIAKKVYGAYPQLLQKIHTEEVLIQKVKECGESPEKWRAFIRTNITPQEFSDLGRLDDKKITMKFGKGLIALAKIFGVDKFTKGDRDHLLSLIQKIFGEEETKDVVVRGYKRREIDPKTKELISTLEKDQKKWSRYLQENIPLDTLASLNSEGKLALTETLGISVGILCKIFNVKEGNPYSQIYPFLLALYRAYEGAHTIDFLERFNKEQVQFQHSTTLKQDVGKWRNYIQSKVTLQECLSADYIDKKSIFKKIEHDIKFFKTIFTLKDETMGDTAYMEFLRNVFIEEKEIWDKEKWKKQLASLYSYNEWTDESKDIQTHIEKEIGMPERALLRIFDIKSELHLTHWAKHLLLGKELYPDQKMELDILIEHARTQQEKTIKVKRKHRDKVFTQEKILNNEIKKEEYQKRISEYFTVTEWTQLSSSKARTFKEIFGISILELARLFEFSGNVRDNQLDRWKFGKHFFGEDPLLIEAIEKGNVTSPEKNTELKETEKQEWKEKTKNTFPIEEWVSMNDIDRKSPFTQKLSIGEQQLATYMGYSWKKDTYFSEEDHLLLGEEIYGPNPLLKDKLLAVRARKKLSGNKEKVNYYKAHPEELLQDIKRLFPEEAWKKTGSKKMSAQLIEHIGIGSDTVGKILELPKEVGRPAKELEGYRALQKRIFE